VELNRTEIPFPELTVVRGIVMAAELRFRIGPRLGAYISKVGADLTEDAIARIQGSHYGYLRMSSSTLKQFIEAVSRQSSQCMPIQLPRLGQLHLWESGDELIPRVNIHCLD
jgi:hypothetical protein